MDNEQLWDVVVDQRRRIADMLAQLSDSEWATPSVCAEWTVKEVAAHVAIVPHGPSPWRMVPMILRARGDLDKVNRDIALTYSGSRTTGQLVAELRDTATSRLLPSVTTLKNLAMDIVVHGQDMAVPLGRDLPVGSTALVNALDRAWTMGWPFHAQKELAQFRLSATDVEWTVGQGTEVRGPGVALLFLVTRRVGAALPLLDAASAVAVRSLQRAR